MSKKQRRWSPEEDAILRQEAERQQAIYDGEIKNWNDIAQRIPSRTNKDCRKRYYNEVAGGLKKGPWTKEEDGLLKQCVEENGQSWAQIASKIETRSADQCSKRWHHCLDPNLNHTSWTDEENRKLLIAVRTHGTTWKDIQVSHFPGRSPNNVKNQYTIINRRSMTIPHDATPCCSVPHPTKDDTQRTQSSPGYSEQGNTELLESFGIGIDVNMDEFEFFDNVSPIQDDFGDLDSDAFELGSSGSSVSKSKRPSFISSSRASTLMVDGDDRYSLSSRQYRSLANPSSQLDLLMLPCNSEQEEQYQLAPNDFFVGESVAGSSTLVTSTDVSHAARHPELENTVMNGSIEEPSAGKSRTTITIDDVPPDALVAVMDILIKSKAKVKFEKE